MHFKPGQRVKVNDPGLAELAAIFKEATGEDPPPNNEGVVADDQYEDLSDSIIINFDDGVAAPYPVEMIEALSLTEQDCTCVLESGCDEEGDPGCAYCRGIDCEWPCPAEVEA